MLKNYLKIAFRNLWKDKFFSFLNISGLAIGIACCLLIVLYVNYELSFDKHFDDADRIHRIVIEGQFNGREFTGAQSPSPAGPVFLEQIPEIEQSVRFRETGSWVVKYQDKVFNENRLVYADQDIFKVFSIPFIYGNPEDALAKPNMMVISRSMATKYFDTEDPMGKALKFDGTENYQVAGVFEDIPGNTHFQFDFIVSFITREEEYNNQAWLNQNYPIYFMLSGGANIPQVEMKMNEIAIDKMSVELKQYLDMTFADFEAAGNSFKYRLQPLTDIHLKSNNYGVFDPGSDIVYVYIFMAIAAFILAIACINFMNLSTARSANRAKEVGVRKVLGSYRYQIINQFITESVLITFLAGVLGLVIANMVLPYFNGFADREMSLNLVNVAPIVAAGSVLVGFMAGLYPAFFLSAFAPVKVLKGNLSLGMKSGGLRKVLVTFQFFVSILLIIATFSISNQLSFIQNKNLGFNKEQVLVLHNAFMLNDNREAMRNAVLQNPAVQNASYTSYLPTSSSRSSTVFFPDAIIDQERGVVSQNWRVDHAYLDVFGLKMKEGRFFSKEYATDSTAMVINQTAAKLFNIESLEGTIIGDFNDDGSALDRYQVIGIVEDFHFESLKEDIGPVIMRLRNSSGFLSLKLSPGELKSALSFVESKWNEFAPGQPFEYTFLDDRFTRMYTSEEKLGDIFIVFAALAIVIACLGLFGLSAFTAEQRTKEVGIRKVLGASMSQLILILSKEVSILIGIAFVIASALGWYGIDWWMQGFAYRPPINILVFFISGAGAFLIAFLTMGYQSVKIAIANPVKALRNE